MNKLLFLSVIILASCQTLTEDRRETHSDGPLTKDTARFEAMHRQYKEPSLYHRRFKHADIDSLIQGHRDRGVLSVAQIGASFEGRAIYELTYGSGDKRIMLWSQMHGDESTATMALFDLFNFLSGASDGFEDVRKLISSKLEVHFIPMLNPDGAERYFRRNAQQIDLNRDARALQTVEGALLAERAKAIEPRYGFNLHDQSIYYNVPNTPNPVAVSLLAPAYNEDREINEVRGGAMRLIVGMNRLLQSYLPNAVAKYDDSHSPRGFGDNFQSWGASTVLIESGGLKGDPEKQQIRKLNFILILNALMEIADSSYRRYDAAEYEQIPFNAAQMHDVLLRNVQLQREGRVYKTDIAIRRSEFTVGRDYYVRGRVEDIGDLSDSYGYDDMDMTGYSFIPGKVANQPVDDPSDLDERSVLAYLRKGIIAVPVKVAEPHSALYQWPLLLFKQNTFFPAQTVDLGGTTNFFIGNPQGELKYAVVNGYLVDLSRQKLPQVKNKIF